MKHAADCRVMTVDAGATCTCQLELRGARRAWWFQVAGVVSGFALGFACAWWW